METPNISDSEWTVMEALWERAPLTASEAAKLLQPGTGWAENTVRTLLARLVKKGVLEARDAAGQARVFVPVLKRDDCVRAAGESFLQRMFRGASKPLLVHFAQRAELTPEEVRELKAILDRSIQPENQPPK